MFLRTIVFVMGVLVLAYFHTEDSHGRSNDVTVYDFLDSSCGSCRADIARDNALNKEDKAHFVGISEDINQTQAQSFITSTQVNFDVKSDPNHSFAARLGAMNRTPSVVIVGPKGMKLINGSVSKEKLESEIAAMR